MGWTVIVVAMVIGGQAEGGASIRVEQLRFANPEACVKAEQFLNERDSFWKNGWGIRIGDHKIRAKCLKDTSIK